MAKEKAYLIVNDGAFILTFQGGSTAKGKRAGNHLPGGTYYPTKTLIGGVGYAGPETLEDRITKELKQETGFTFTRAAGVINNFSMNLDSTQVTFVVQTVPNVEGSPYWSDPFVVPPTTNVNDTPFTSLKKFPIGDCKSGKGVFKIVDGTDWFAHGVEEALSLGLI
jgi:hypothetical protein